MQDTKDRTESGSAVANGKASAPAAQSDRTVPKNALRRRVVRLGSNIWKFIWNSFIQVVLLGLGVSLLASFITSPGSTTDLSTRLSDYLRALDQNLLVAAVVFGSLVLFVLMTLFADLQEKRWERLDTEKKTSDEEKQKKEDKEREKQEDDKRLRTALDDAKVRDDAADGSAAASEEYPNEDVPDLTPKMCGVEYGFMPLYCERDEDKKVRDALARLAAQAVKNAQEHSVGDGQSLGVTIVGKHGSGKSRLVYEAVKNVQELKDWTLVRWPISKSEHPYNFRKAQQDELKVIVLLDRMQDAPTSSRRRPQLGNVPDEFAKRSIPFIVVTTYSEDNPRVRAEKSDETSLSGREKIELTGIAEKSLAPWLSGLERFELKGISQDQAKDISTQLRDRGGTPKKFDGETPGSLFKERPAYEYPYLKEAKDKYTHLHPEGKMLMKMLLLFHSVGIGTASGEAPVTKARACALADVLFDIPRFQWRAATDDLIENFNWPADDGDLIQPVVHSWLMSSFERALYVEDGAVFAAVDDYPINPDEITNNIQIEDWSVLHQAMRQIGDGEALLTLGAALIDSQLHLSEAQAPSKLENLRRAADCYRSALETQFERERETIPVNWAVGQRALAGALDAQYSHMRADDDDPSPATILQQAEAAYRAALEILTFDAYRDDWVGLTTQLSAVFQNQAELVDGAERDTLLEEAARMAQTAVNGVRAGDLEGSAGAKTTLAYVKIAQAKAATSVDAVEALETEAKELASSALDDVYDLDSDDSQANAEANLQYIFRFQASLVTGSQRAEQLDAVADELRDTLSNYSATTSDQIQQESWMQAVLAEALLQLARMDETEGALAKQYLEEVEALCHKAEEALEKLRLPDRGSWILGTHAGVLAQRVRRSDETDRDNLLRLLREGERYGAEALSVPNHVSAPEDWANTQLSNAEVQFQFARLELAGTEDEKPTALRDLNTARRYVEAALEVYRLPAFKGEYEYAMTLRNEIDKQIAALSAEVEA